MTRNDFFKPFLVLVSLPLLFVVNVSHEAQLGLTLVRDAHAIVGAPLTPVSYAGVARRTTRRAVAYTSSATAAAASATTQQQAATAQQQSATAAQQSATAQQQSATARQQAAAAGPPVGTVINTLPAGCAPVVDNGVEYHRCGNVYYRAAFQGNNLVYVSQ